MSSKCPAFLPDTFVLVLLAAIALASVLPARGTLAAVTNIVTTIGIGVLFFLHGARLASATLLEALRHWRLHLTIFCVTFVLFPLLGWGASRLMRPLLPAELWVGVLFLCTLPSTVQSSIAFTSIARGNVAATVASAAASNILGIALTPILVGLLTRAGAHESSYAGIRDIMLQMLVPFLAGHACRPLIGGWVARHKAMLSITDRGTIVLAVYSAFSAAVVERLWDQLPLLSLATLLGFCAALLAVVLFAARAIARALGFDRADEISIVFAGRRKVWYRESRWQECCSRARMLGPR